MVEKINICLDVTIYCSDIFHPISFTSLNVGIGLIVYLCSTQWPHFHVCRFNHGSALEGYISMFPA